MLTSLNIRTCIRYLLQHSIKGQDRHNFLLLENSKTELLFSIYLIIFHDFSWNSLIDSEGKRLNMHISVGLRHSLPVGETFVSVQNCGWEALWYPNFYCSRRFCGGFYDCIVSMPSYEHFVVCQELNQTYGSIYERKYVYQLKVDSPSFNF